MPKRLSELPVSILDLATVAEEDRSLGDTFQRSLRMVQAAEAAGYTRYWFSEHHNMESVASSAPSVLLGYMAAGSSRIRLGAGGVMLPNHAPLVIAEQFGTLDALYPGRFELALGRAPGTDPVTAKALRRVYTDSGDYPREVVELLHYFADGDPSTGVKAVPGNGSGVPVWLLGSSTYSAQLAGLLGLPFGFAAHFAPAQLMDALDIYRSTFRPSVYLDKPYTLACVNTIIAESEEEAEFLASSLYQMVLGMFRNQRRPLRPPVRDIESFVSTDEMREVRKMLWYSFFGDQASVQQTMQAFVNQTEVDEVMISSVVYDEQLRLGSLIAIGDMFKKNK